jgi:hypothetical protein
MWRWVIWSVLIGHLTGCATATQWRRRTTVETMDAVFAECAERHQAGQYSTWSEMVRCGNDGARQILTARYARSTELVRFALQYRLTIAQQMDAGTLSETEGQARLNAVGRYLHTLPASFDALLSLDDGNLPST